MALTEDNTPFITSTILLGQLLRNEGHLVHIETCQRNSSKRIVNIEINRLKKGDKGDYRDFKVLILQH